MKVLITGITGMIGSEFMKQYEALGYDVYGLSRNTSSGRIHDVVQSKRFKTDILDEQSLKMILNTVKPDIVIHMAAQAFNGDSWNLENYTHLVNYQGTLNILRTVRDVTPDSKILLACSSAEYGLTDSDLPINEDRLLKPVTPYGVSKVATECLGYQYYKNYNLKVYLPRLFIHLGTGHPPATAVQNFAKQIAMIIKGKMSKTIKVGNLESSRDFIDVRDGVAAMILLLEKGNPGQPVNICSGTEWKIADVLNKFIEMSGMKDEIIVNHDKDLVRKSDEAHLRGDNSKIRSLGWKQKYSIDTTLKGILDDWLERV